MLKKILSEKLLTAFKNVNLNLINEVRLRLGAPIVVDVGGSNYYLTFNGLNDCEDDAIITRSSNIDYVLQKISNDSLYTINDQLVNGYVTFDGMRIGVSGELVVVNGKIKTLKNITGLNIRIPHIIKNCSLPIYKLLVSDCVKSTLIISPPGVGKTTFLRDFAYQIKTKENGKYNILIADERCEITSMVDDNYLSGIDVYKNCSKEFAFTNGIRSMKPHVIITDELDVNNDLPIIENALCSGVKVVASVHANNLTDLKNKRSFIDILNKNLFERFVVLSNSNGYGTIEGVYNENMRCIYA